MNLQDRIEKILLFSYNDFRTTKQIAAEITSLLEPKREECCKDCDAGMYWKDAERKCHHYCHKESPYSKSVKKLNESIRKTFEEGDKLFTQESPSGDSRAVNLDRPSKDTTDRLDGFKEAPATPDTEEWITQFDDEIWPREDMSLGSNAHAELIKAFISRHLTTAYQKGKKEGFTLGIDKKFQDDREQKGYERGYKTGQEEQRKKNWHFYKTGKRHGANEMKAAAIAALLAELKKGGKIDSE